MTEDIHERSREAVAQDDREIEALLAYLQQSD